MDDERVRARLSRIWEKHEHVLVLRVVRRSLLLLLSLPVAAMLAGLIAMSAEVFGMTEKRVGRLLSASVEYSDA